MLQCVIVFRSAFHYVKWVCAQATVDYSTLRRIFPAWRRGSLMKFLSHYNRYHFMHLDHEPTKSELQKLEESVVKQVEHRSLLSVCMKVKQTD